MILPPARAKALGVVAITLVVTAGWLRYGPAIAVTLAGGGGGVRSEALFTLVVFAPLLAAGILGAVACALSTWRAGRSPARAGPLGAAIGLGGILLAAGYAALAGTVQRGAGSGLSVALLAGLVVIAFQVVAEEMLFRGWLQPLLATVTGPPVAIGTIAVAFAGLHLLAGAHDAVALVNLTLGGMLFGLLAARDGGIAGAYGAHFAWNIVEQLGLGLDPNPGVGSFGALVDLDLVGALRWGGSDDALNASWAMSIALCAVLVPLGLWRTRRETPASAAQAALSPSPRRPT